MNQKYRGSSLLARQLTFALLFFIISIPAISIAQGANEGDEVFELSPFEVNTSSDSAYLITTSTSATRINAPIRELPMNLVVAGAELMEDTKTFELTDALNYMGGTSRVGGSAEPRYSLRGFTTSQVMRNGVRTFGPPDASPDSSGVSRVEILKGPAAIIFGISAPGGIINYVTAKPTLERFANLSLNTGSNSLFRSDLTVNGALSKEHKVSARLDWSYLSEERGLRYQGISSRSLNGSIRWQPSSKTDIVFSANDFSRSLERTGGIPFAREAGNSQQTLLFDYTGWNENTRFPKWAFQNDEDSFYELNLTHTFNEHFSLRVFASTLDNWGELFQHGGDLRRADNTFGWDLANEDIVADAYYVNRDMLWRESEGATDVYQVDGAFAWEMGRFQSNLTVGLESVLQEYNRYTSFLTSDDPAFIAEVDALLPNIDVSINPGNNRIRFTMPFFDKNAQADRERLIDALGGFDALSFSARNQDRGFELESKAVFANYQLSFGEERRTRIMAGFRHDDFEVTDLTVQGGETNQATGTSPQFGATQDITENITLYGLYSQSISPNPGSQAFAPDVTPLADGASFDPEYGAGFDFGFKFSMAGGRVNGTLTYFDVKRKNIVRAHPDITLSEAVSDATGESLVELSGQERNRGIEMDIAASLLDQRLNIFGGFTYLTDSEVEGSNQPVIWARKLTASLWVKYRFTGDRWFVTGGWIHKDQPEVRSFFNGSSEYDRFDLGFGYDFKGTERWDATFSVLVKNVTDKEYADPRGALAYPRRIVAGVKIRL